MPVRSNYVIPLPIDTAPIPDAAPTPQDDPCLFKKQLPIDRIEQKTYVWCWAACSEMVMKYAEVDPTPTQSAMAEAEFNLYPGKCGCCGENGPCPQQCIKPAWPDGAYRRHGIKFTYCHAPIDFETLKHNLDRGQPVEAYIVFDEAAAFGHVVLVIGYHVGADKAQYVLVNDPMKRPRLNGHILFSDFERKDTHTWKGTYTFNLPKLPTA